ncbi:hypothetical protein DI487_15115 [Flavobacterium sediminis]|uniref:Uncharacterized protein n=1 Tax=Flavobacterium sediminis TaxID=2201181 RepID=A0A2U8QY17_9FLAO|nr:hypothetical protein DI487_15115 [Flavobacterium sediminis]
MMYNLKQKLDKFQAKIELSEILSRLQIAENSAFQYEGIRYRLKNSNGEKDNFFQFDLLETDKIYHIDAIRKLSIDYRLRFLDTKYYKNDYQESTIHKIADFEEKHGTELANFKILAPKDSFKLDNYDDPLLFMTLGNDHYYLLDHWGNDLHWSKKLMAWPLKNLTNLIFSTALLSLLTTNLVNLGSGNTLTDVQFLIILLFSWKWIIAITFFFLIKKGNNVSEYNWNSPFYNH